MSRHQQRQLSHRWSWGKRATFLVVAAFVPSAAVVVSHASAAPPAPREAAVSDDVRHNGGTVANETVAFGDGDYLTRPSNASPETIVRRYLRSHAHDFGLSPNDVGSFRVDSELTTPHDGVTRIVLQQTVSDLPVHTAALVGLVDAEGRLAMLGGRTAEPDTSGSVDLTAGDAISVAAEEAGADDPAKAPKGSATKARGRQEYPNPYAENLRDPEPVSAEQVWHITDEGLRRAWLTDVETGPGAWLGVVVDAETGEVLEVDDRYSSDGPDGDVFTDQHPDVPGATRTREDFSGVNGTWVTGTTTSGNNVNAYRDLDDNDANDEYQPSNADQHFRYSFTDAWRGLPDGTNLGAIPPATVTAALNADIDAAITQLFYYTNDMHDWLWGFGFDEASGNFQVANPSGNGVAGDPVLAEAQDGFNFGCQDNAMPPNAIRCLNNANFGTNADGSTARMQMYMWARPNRPYREGSMDGDVIAHEYGHGVSNRLVPMTLSGAINQAGSLGEGWSDAVSFLRWGDDVIGEYVTGNANRGIRSSRYNAHTDTYGDYSLGVTSPHRNGEIWAATMYDIRVLLGLDTTTQLVLDGMRSTPNGPSPTFLDARDGILANDAAANGGANRCALWTAFAGRGMGTGAVSNGLHAVPTEDFSLPPECLPAADANGPYVTPEGTNVSLDGSGSTAGSDPSAGAIVSYDWDLDDDGQFDDASGPAVDFTAVGQDGVFDIGLQVTDAWGNTSTDSSTVTVTNVLPTVSIDPITAIDEFGTTTVSGTITDPGWLDVLTATIDFDDGAGPQNLSGVLENVRPDATFTFSVDHQYGDDGTFEVEVTGFDDDGSSSSTADANVANVDPLVTIDTSGEQVYDGVSAFIVEAGEDLTVPADVADPGSDDLTTTWDWDDGTNSVIASLVNPPVDDPLKSPTVQPRDLNLDATHAYGDACLYELDVTAVDDDGGSGSDAATVVITGNADTSRGSGYWYANLRPKKPNDFSTAELECYLAIAGFFSLVFPDGLTRTDGREILNSPAKSPEEIIFDEEALAAWLNFANGAVKLDTMVDSTGDGIPDSTFGDAMFVAESVRVDPTATSNEIKAQKDIVERIVLRDES